MSAILLADSLINHEGYKMRLGIESRIKVLKEQPMLEFISDLNLNHLTDSERLAIAKSRKISAINDLEALLK
ncbi:hypothetical protein [Leptospira sp. GIMC2001]|uniref:hypothetical protein n=1 Tax=Leptospira sp. GIMC2001 TaxID=1513297 RepID=UPI00234AB60A|nr:hypothetical protein [Leptospira sp. GIMC2001]WCL51523.1 hypothetical protein O4O04_20110 [Leptospira sp. GIMC2001]